MTAPVRLLGSGGSIAGSLALAAMATTWMGWHLRGTDPVSRAGRWLVAWKPAFIDDSDLVMWILVTLAISVPIALLSLKIHVLHMASPLWPFAIPIAVLIARCRSDGSLHHSVASYRLNVAVPDVMWPAIGVGLAIATVTVSYVITLTGDHIEDAWIRNILAIGLGVAASVACIIYGVQLRFH